MNAAVSIVLLAAVLGVGQGGATLIGNPNIHHPEAI